MFLHPFLSGFCYACQRNVRLLRRNKRSINKPVKFVDLFHGVQGHINAKGTFFKCKHISCLSPDEIF